MYPSKSISAGDKYSSSCKWLFCLKAVSLFGGTAEYDVSPVAVVSVVQAPAHAQGL